MSKKSITYTVNNFPTVGQYFVNHPEIDASCLGTFNCNTIAPKFILTGEPAVGKTCFAVRIVKDEFKEDYQATIGVNFYQAFGIINSTNVKFQLWDVAGQETYTDVTKHYFRGAEVVFFCFDLTRPQTLLALTNWIKRVENETENTLCAKFLIGCKCDLPTAVPTEEIQSFAQKNNLEYFCISAKEKIKTTELFKRATFISSIMLQQKRDQNPASKVQIQETVQIDAPQAPEKKKNGCCK